MPAFLARTGQAANEFCYLKASKKTNYIRILLENLQRHGLDGLDEKRL